MTSKKRERATSKASKTHCRRAEGSRKKLAEAFIAHLDRSWQQHGREILASGPNGPGFIFEGDGQAYAGVWIAMADVTRLSRSVFGARRIRVNLL
jgi:hypothetical protein